MRRPILLVAISLLAIAGVGQTQQPQLPPVTITLPEPVPVPQMGPMIPQPQRLVPTVATKPVDPTVDQMLDELEALRIQKAELEKKESEMVAAIGKKVETQSARMKKLGIGSEKPVANEVESKPIPSPSLLPVIK